MYVAYTGGMKYLIALLMFVTVTACAKKTEVRAPEIVHEPRYSYMLDAKGTFYIFTTNTKDFDEAMKKIHPGPSSVDKVDLWVVTPIESMKK